ncbi:MAG TPA: hypothetical protein VF188_01990 [Longimicrobiales bacterium]
MGNTDEHDRPPVQAAAAPAAGSDASDRARIRGEQLRAAGAHGPLQWMAAGISAALTIGILAFLAWDGLTPDRPPDFEIRPGPIRRIGEAYQLPLYVRNRGDLGVAGVRIRAALLRDDSVVSHVDLTLDWLPGGSQRRVTAVFTRDPRRYRIGAAVRGYIEP